MTDSSNILTPAGYWARYQDIYSSCDTDKEAWSQLEKELGDRYGIGKYDTYESFRVGKHRYYKKVRQASDILR